MDAQQVPTRQRVGRGGPKPALIPQNQHHHPSFWHSLATTGPVVADRVGGNVRSSRMDPQQVPTRCHGWLRAASFVQIERWGLGGLERLGFLLPFSSLLSLQVLEGP